MRRNGLLYVAPLALAMSVGLACSSSVDRSNFGNEPDPDAQGGPDFGEKPDASNKGEGCSSSKTEISRVPVVIEFVVDESGSMDTSNYWTAARDALLAAFEEMNATPDPAMFIGLMRYSTSVDENIKPAALTEPGHYDDLVDTIDTPEAGGGSTATAAALKSAFSILEKFKPKSTAGLVTDQMNRAVVLLSDGVPDDKAACETLVEQKANASPPNGPIKTFAVGIGKFGVSASTYDPQFMGRLAQKGLTAPQDCALDATDPTATCHFQITPGEDVNDTKQALINAFNRIRALSASCEFTFETNESTDLNNVNVSIMDKDGNATPIDQDPDNGWSFDNDENPTKVILNGDACSASNGAVSGRVDVTIGCRGAN